MASDLAKLINQSSAIEEIDIILEARGITSNTHKEFVEFLDVWQVMLSREMLPVIMKSRVKGGDYPDLKVEGGGIEYHIHGLVHGWPIYRAPGWHPRPRLIEQVSKRAESFHNPSEHEDYFYEERFDTIFDLLKSQELPDITATAAGKVSWVRDLGKKVALPLVAFSSVAGYLHSKALFNPKKYFNVNSLLMQDALADEKYQEKYSRLHSAFSLPEPLDLEKSHLEWKCTDLNSILFYGVASPSERSLWVAKELKKQAKENNLEKVHYFCGMGHSTQIAYFLKHPDYSFDKLEEYRISKKPS
ncbi:MAG: hypothetical protein ABIB71_04315 [Candidatus Woesearchaeota archaeon]